MIRRISRIIHGKRKIEQRTFERREYCGFCENDFASTLDLKRHMKKKQCYGLYNIVRKAFGKSLIRKKPINSTFDIPKFEKEQDDNRMKKYGDVGRIISKFSVSKVENKIYKNNNHTPDSIEDITSNPEKADYSEDSRVVNAFMDLTKN